MPGSRILRVLLAVYVAATLVHVGWIVAHEPFSFDAWNVASDTHGQPFSLGHLLGYWRLEYTHSNPRLGQVFAYLGYKLDPFTIVATPLAYLAISLAVTVLGLGRWPWRRDRDLALWAFAIGALWFALPELGKTLFCRSYASNYVYGAAILLAFIVPLRLSPAGRARPLACAAYALLGVAAGMCNEHTGPTLLAALALYIWWQRRRGERPTLAWAGLAGATAGFAAILFAPGQGDRYGGAIHKTSLLARAIQRNVIGNLDILRGLLEAAAPVLALIAIVLVIAAGDEPDEAGRACRRRALGLIARAMLAGVAMAATIFVSPRLGSRFYLVSCALLLAGFVALADVVLTTRRRLAPLVVLAVLASIYAAVRTVPLYAEVARESDARLAALEATPVGHVAFVDGFEQVDESWWFYGDDLRGWDKRERVANYLGLSAVVFRGHDEGAPLAVSSARFVPIATTDPPGAYDGRGFAIASVSGHDLAGLHAELRAAAAVVRDRLAGRAQLEQLDVAVELADPRAPMPRPRVLVGRWRPDGFTGPVARIGYHLVSRDVVLPAELRGRALEIYAMRVGDPARRIGSARDATLSYAPWGGGVYWILACDRDECFVIAVVAQHT